MIKLSKIIFTTSFVFLNSFGATQDLDSNVKRKVGALVAANQESIFFSHIRFGEFDLNKCDSATNLINCALGQPCSAGAIEKLWSSSTFWGSETPGSLKALENRLDRFAHLPTDARKMQCMQVMQLHVRMSENFLDALIRLKEESPTAWSYALEERCRYLNLFYFSMHLEALKNFNNDGMPSLLKSQSIEKFVSIFSEENIKRFGRQKPLHPFCLYLLMPMWR
ncbi:MAG: hypothetical protein WCG05_03745 [Alphaproteobacteria bacterium]